MRIIFNRTIENVWIIILVNLCNTIFILTKAEFKLFYLLFMVYLKKLKPELGIHLDDAI
jgi:hypothetical protein